MTRRPCDINRKIPRSVEAFFRKPSRLTFLLMVVGACRRVDYLASIKAMELRYDQDRREKAKRDKAAARELADRVIERLKRRD